MRSAMKKIRIHRLYWISFFIFFFSFISQVHSQVGIGAEGLYSHPGISKSEKLNISIDPDIGYGFFFKHPVYSSNKLKIYLRYTADIIDHDVTIEGIKYKYSLSNLNGSIVVYLLVHFHKSLHSRAAVYECF